MEVMIDIFIATFNFFNTTNLNIFGWTISLWEICMVGISFEVAYWLIQMWRGENGTNQ